MVLVVGLMLIVVLMLLGTTAVMTSTTVMKISSNYKQNEQVFYLADAGIQHARVFLNQNQSNWDSYAYATAQTLIASTQLANIGTYTVTIQDGGGGSRRVSSTGNTSSNARAVVEALMRLGPYTPGSAITVGGDLTVSGNPTVSGTNGGVHANGDLSISGSPNITADATASGTYSASGNPTVGGTAAGGQSTETIPTVNPADFFSQRDFRLASDGKVYNSAGIEQPMPGNKWNNWDFSGGKWTLSGNSTVNGTFYIEGNTVISGNPGDSEDPWIASLIATGDIEISGNPVVRPPNQSDPGGLFRDGTENLLFVAGRDLKINGNPQQGFQGIMAAHEQISASGNPTLNGFIIAEDAEAISGTVTGNSIGGNMNITYNGGMGNPFPGDVEMRTWQQVY